MAETRNTLELINTITEFNDLSKYMADTDLDEALAKVVKILANQDIPPAKALVLIVQLQAMSTKFAILASVYSTILKDKAGTANNHKKNIYYSTSQALDDLVSALKYVTRA
jgi:poly-D-alanine transfer protein DltD